MIQAGHTIDCGYTVTGRICNCSCGAEEVNEYIRDLKVELSVYRNFIDHIPYCSGEWIGGSGGHREHLGCKNLATWGFTGDMFAYCDEHIVEQDKAGPYGYQRFEWADMTFELNKFINNKE